MRFITRRVKRSLSIALNIFTIAVFAELVGGLLFGDPELPMLKGGNPIAWLLYWPLLLWSGKTSPRPGDLDTLFAFAINFVLYFLAGYLLLTVLKPTTDSAESQT